MKTQTRIRAAESAYVAAMNIVSAAVVSAVTAHDTCITHRTAYHEARTIADDAFRAYRASVDGATRKAYDSAVCAVFRADRMLKTANAAYSGLFTDYRAALKKANAAKLKFDKLSNSVIFSAQ